MFNFALEQINYQRDDKFKKELTDIIESIYKDFDHKVVKTNKDVYLNTDHCKKIIALIKDRFNITVVMDHVLADHFPAAIMPFSSDLFSNSSSSYGYTPNKLKTIFGSVDVFKQIKAMVKDREKALKELHGKSGYVDYKHARVGGYLAEARHYLIINFQTLRQLDLTPIEVAGVITHEVGHAFTGLSNHYRMVKTNSAITDVLDNINKNRPDKSIQIFKSEFGVKELEAAKLSTDSTVEDFQGAVAKAYVGKMSSIFMDGKYTETNFEYLADSFATRMGFGKELVTGLEKIHLAGFVMDITVGLVMNILFISVIMLLVYGLLTAFGFPVLIICVFILVYTTGTLNEDMTYDRTLTRYNRIRQSIIVALKDKHLPLEFTRGLIEQIEAIDVVIKHSIGNLDFDRYLTDYIKPGDRQARRYIDFQKSIENSLNNNLFLKSAQLRSL